MPNDKTIADGVLKTGAIKWKDLEFLQKPNFKDMTPEGFDKLKTSMIKNDFCETFKVWENGKTIYCLDGFHRCKALEALSKEGYKIPDKFQASFIKCTDKQDAAKKVLIYSSVYATMTSEGLYEFSADWGIDWNEVKFEIDLPAFDSDKYDEGYGNDNGYGDEKDDIPEPPINPVSKLGELYLLGGRHRLYCGDSVNHSDVKTLLNGIKADMIFTDPPYGVDYEGGHFHSGDVNIKRTREKLANDNNPDIYSAAIPIMAEYCDGPIYTWFAGGKGLNIYQAIAEVGEISALIIWHKTNATYAAMNAQYKQRHEPCLYWKPRGSTLRWIGATTEATLWEMKKDGRNEFHPTQKPVELAERAIANHKAENVLDLFGGSGSTLLACEQLNRTCYMMEMEPAYIDVIIERYKNATGKDVEKIN